MVFMAFWWSNKWENDWTDKNCRFVLRSEWSHPAPHKNRFRQYNLSHVYQSGSRNLSIRIIKNKATSKSFWPERSLRFRWHKIYSKVHAAGPCFDDPECHIMTRQTPRMRIYNGGGLAVHAPNDNRESHYFFRRAGHPVREGGEYAGWLCHYFGQKKRQSWLTADPFGYLKNNIPLFLIFFLDT